MSRFVANLGGAFLFSHQPRVLAEWYQRVLDLQPAFFGEHGECYLAFPYRQKDDPGEVSTFVWSILRHREGMEHGHRPRVMVNYRVRDMAEFLAHLRSLGLEPDDYQEAPGEGKFAHLTDPEGNVLEIWEDGFVYDAES